MYIYIYTYNIHIYTYLYMYDIHISEQSQATTSRLPAQEFAAMLSQNMHSFRLSVTRQVLYYITSVSLAVLFVNRCLFHTNRCLFHIVEYTNMGLF